MPTPVETAERDLRTELGNADLEALASEQSLRTSLSQAVHRYCETARASGAQPERVILDLKGIIHDHFQSSALRPGVLARDVVWHAVRRCVRAYYDK